MDGATPALLFERLKIVTFWSTIAARSKSICGGRVEDEAPRPIFVLARESASVARVLILPFRTVNLCRRAIAGLVRMKSGMTLIANRDQLEHELAKDVLVS
ncbi:hypothetical protein ACVWZV_000841 [Bradyrhizobium sp. GM5.1]